MWICGRCSTLWGAWLHQCASGGCGGGLRRVNQGDASHPVLARYPVRALLPVTVAPVMTGPPAPAVMADQPAGPAQRPRRSRGID